MMTSKIHEFRLGDWRVFPLQNRLERDGQAVRIQHLSMQVLLYLASQPGLVVTYDEMLETLWPGRIAGEEAVHRRVADLRRHLQDNARSPDYIENIPKRGYRLVTPVEAILEANGSGWSNDAQFATALAR